MQILPQAGPRMGCSLKVNANPFIISFNSLSLSLSRQNAHHFFQRCSFTYIAPFIAFQPSIYTSQRNNLDAYPIKPLLEVLQRAVSCGITVQVSFPHKCSQFNWCKTLNVEVVVTFLDISSFRCLHNSVVFLRALLSGAGSYIKYSQGAFAHQDPQLTGQLTFFPQTFYSQFQSISK